MVSMVTSKLHIVAHDIHYPLVHKPTLNAMLDFMGHNVVSSFTFGGDQLDLACISHHNAKKFKFKPPGAYFKDVNGFDANVLADVESRLKKGTRKVWHIGNHERFEQDLCEEHPEMEGTIDHAKLLNLELRGWSIIPLGHSSSIGKLKVIHGEVLSSFRNLFGIFPSRKAVEMYGCNVLAGHTHAPQSYARISPVEHVHKHMGWIAPILGSCNPSYLQNRPTAWLNGFTIVETMEDGNFNVYPIITTKGRFSFSGTIYG